MEPEQQFKWALLLIECMKQLKAEGLGFTDQEVVPGLDGDPNGMFAWFICGHHAEKEKFELRNAIEALKTKMRDAGFPRSAIDTLRGGVTSETEIQAGGGRFYFFR